jgi:hypothetical protein
MGDRKRAREVAEEDGAGLQRRDEDRVLVAVDLRQLSTQLDDAAADLVARQVDLPDRVAVGRETRG